MNVGGWGWGSGWEGRDVGVCVGMSVFHVKNAHDWRKG